MNLRKLIEEINKLTEDEFIDQFNTEVSDEDLKVNDDLTKELNAKTKVSRALDVLKEAIDDFKDVALEELDLITDADLSKLLECLDDIVVDIKNVLTGKEKVEEKPEEKEEIEIEEKEDIEPSEEANTQEAEDEEAEEVNFDDEAELDLFGSEED